MHAITVVNKKRGGTGEYIGRPSVLENGWTSKSYGGGIRVGSVAESIACFERDLRTRIARKGKGVDAKTAARDHAVCAELNRLYALAQERPVSLVCWCAPGPCHGDVIKRVLEEAHARITAARA